MGVGGIRGHGPPRRSKACLKSDRGRYTLAVPPAGGAGWGVPVAARVAAGAQLRRGPSRGEIWGSVRRTRSGAMYAYSRSRTYLSSHAARRTR